MSRYRAFAVIAPLAVLFCFSLSGFADPPARVGRLNYLSGSVSFRPGDLDDWEPAVINVPLKTGDRLWSDANSHAEIHVGSTALRLAPETAFSFLNLDDRTIQISLTQGALNVRLRQLGEADVFEIDTPNAAVSLLRPGLYRIDVDSQGDTTVTDRLGESEVTATGSAFTVHPQETASIMGADAPTYDIQAAFPPDDWDNWCSGRDRREERSVSARYVSREMVGYEDLDEFGAWRTVPEYGVVWVPAGVPRGWAPYRYGHWVWVEPWGWTWVDDMPWGFAPFHYGRWTHIQGTWMWVPGRLVVRPVYAPALVAFVGGSNWNLSVSVGSGVAWFPLGPREVYVPAYRVSNAYVRNVNVTHVNVTNINVTNVNVVNATYVNRTVPGAVTAVPRETFVRAQAVSKAAVPVSQQAAARASISGMTAPVAPRQESLVTKSSASAAVARPPVHAMNRTVVARNTPPPQPVPFAARQSALAANPGQPLDAAKPGTLRSNAPAAPSLVKPAAPPAASNDQPPSTLHPARPGLQAAHRASETTAQAPEQHASKPNPPRGGDDAGRPNPKAPVAQNDRPPSARTVPNAIAQQPPRQRPSAETATPPEKNDRPNNAAAPRGGRKPDVQPAPPEASGSPAPGARQERPTAPSRPQAAEQPRHAPPAQAGPERGTHPGNTREADKKAKTKPAESEKQESEDRQHSR